VFTSSLHALHLCCREVLAAVAGVLLASHLLSCSMALLVALLLGGLQLWCWFEAAQRVEYIRGHRAGAHGYDGAWTGVKRAAAANAGAEATNFMHASNDSPSDTAAAAAAVATGMQSCSLMQLWYTIKPACLCF
jgi:hypothetical protein